MKTFLTVAGIFSIIAAFFFFSQGDVVWGIVCLIMGVIPIAASKGDK